MSDRPAATDAADDTQPLDLAEKGRRGGQVISLNRRLFMKFTAFGGCADADAAIAALTEDGVTGALYLDASDPQGIGLIATAEDPEYFVTTLRSLLNREPFASFTHKPELDMLGRTYSIGYEPDLEETLFKRPLSKIKDPKNRWAIWYPLQRSKKFQTLPADHQRRILAEHGSLAKRYGAGGHANDRRPLLRGFPPRRNAASRHAAHPNRGRRRALRRAHR